MGFPGLMGPVSMELWAILYNWLEPTLKEIDLLSQVTTPVLGVITPVIRF